MRTEQEDPLYRTIVENARDAMVYSDRDGIIRLWNTGAERMFGYSKAEALGRSLDLIIPESLRSRHWEGYRKVMAAGTSRYESDLLTVPALKKDGGRISVEFTLVPIPDVAGRLDGIAAILRDVTERWNREKATRQRLAELEARCGVKAAEKDVGQIGIEARHEPSPPVAVERIRRRFHRDLPRSTIRPSTAWLNW